MSRFDDLLDWATGYTKEVNQRRTLELEERKVQALERQSDRKARAYIKEQLDAGCAYVILPNKLARRLV